jgi:hypothetical protein
MAHTASRKFIYGVSSGTTFKVKDLGFHSGVRFVRFLYGSCTNIVRTLYERCIKAKVFILAIVRALPKADVEWGVDPSAARALRNTIVAVARR